MHRPIKAFLVALLVPALLFVVCISAAGLISGGMSLAPAVAYSAPIWMMFAAPVSYAVAGALGIPGYFLFRRFGWLTLRGLVGGASVLGILVGGAFSSVFASDSFMSWVAVTIMFGTYGAAAGFIFWWVSGTQAPNNSLKRDPVSGSACHRAP